MRTTPSSWETAAMKMAVEMVAVSMEKPSGALPRSGGVPEQSHVPDLGFAMAAAPDVNDSMVAYKEVYNELEKLFDGCEVHHISRLSNDEADVLANIGSQCLAIPPGVFWEEITERSTKPKKAQKKKKEKEEETSTVNKEAQNEEEDQELVMMVEVPWMQAYISYILRKEIPDDPVEARRVIRRSKAFT
ncbi:hypothetical protein QYE76_067720 [Lolium multiflorum]|uniref:RNase H type-1 domain-containing protein n=1 Tax=Lolium multiflorum TaxID=4521 RepID=A0AAD8SD56_LOLMU|nr:hypothetical protein QYE76_067720 [Lolium multiflorum]